MVWARLRIDKWWGLSNRIGRGCHPKKVQVETFNHGVGNCWPRSGSDNVAWNDPTVAMANYWPGKDLICRSKMTGTKNAILQWGSKYWTYICPIWNWNGLNVGQLLLWLSLDNGPWKWPWPQTAMAIVMVNGQVSRLWMVKKWTCFDLPKILDLGVIHSSKTISSSKDNS